MDLTSLDLRALARQIPAVGDRALAEIVNGLSSVESLTEARQSHGFLRRLLGGGRLDRRRELESTATLVRVQRQMVARVREVSDHLAFTDLNVGLLALEVEHLQSDVLRIDALSRQALAEVREVAALLAEYIDVTERRLTLIEERLDDHEARLDAQARALVLLERRVVVTELWQRAWAEQDHALRRWRHDGAYGQLPWLCQVILLARQAAAGTPGLHEFVAADRGWRDRLADELLHDDRFSAEREVFRTRGTRTVRALVDDAIGQLPASDSRRLVAELLGIGLPQGLRPPHRPMAYAVAHGLELAARDPQAQTSELARAAVARARREYGHLPDYVTAEEFVRRAVDEQADAAHQARAILAEQRRSSPAPVDVPFEPAEPDPGGA